MSGEVLRRILGLTITKCISQDLVDLGSKKQLCLSQRSGIQFAIRSLQEKFEEGYTESFLQLDPENAFNSPRCELAAKNCKFHVRHQYTTPSQNNLLCSSIRRNSCQWKAKHKTILLAMVRYSIAAPSLNETMENERIMQRRYADDGSVARKLEDQHHVLDNVMKHERRFTNNVENLNNPRHYPGGFPLWNQNNLP